MQGILKVLLFDEFANNFRMILHVFRRKGKSLPKIICLSDAPPLPPHATYLIPRMNMI